MKKTEHNKNPEFLEEVYQLTQGATCSEALEISLKIIDEIDVEQLKRIGLKTYEKEKWTIPIILQHLIDWERIWCFRAVIFARAEGTIPVAHDQEIMGKHSNANELSVEQLINELKVVRQSSILLFQSFNKKILNMNCEFFEYEMPLHAIGLTIAAHQIHHMKLLKERYLPLDEG